MAYDHRIPSREDLRGFSMVWLRAIALAWENEEFHDELINADDARSVLEQWFNYVCPFAIKIKVKDRSRQEEPRYHIEFGLPEKPDSSKYDEGIAITAFVSSGPVYLFTCC